MRNHPGAKPYSIFMMRMSPNVLPIILLCLLTWTGHLVAQEAYVEMPVNDYFKDPDKFKEADNNQKYVFLGTNPYEGRNKQLFDGWFKLYYFPQMTHIDRLDSLPSMREEFLKNFLKPGLKKNPELKPALLEIAFEMTKEIATGDYHPVARYNAMLLLGELNTTELNRLTKEKPEPLMKALGVLVTEFKNPDQIDSVRLAALLGILRHCEIRGTAMPPAARDMIIADMLDVIAEKQPPAGRSQEGHAWFQRRAFDVLGALGTDDQDGRVVTAIVGALNQIDNDLGLRCAAATALGRLKLNANSRLNVPAATKGLNDLAMSVCQSELAAIAELQKEFQSQQDPRAQGTQNLVTNTGIQDALKKRQTLRTRRRVKSVLVCINSALNGVGSASGIKSQVKPNDPAAKQVAELEQTVKTLIAATDKTDQTFEEVTQSVQTALGKLAGNNAPAGNPDPELPAEIPATPPSPDGLPPVPGAGEPGVPDLDALPPVNGLP